MTLNLIKTKKLCSFITTSFLIFFPVFSEACDRTALTTYMEASNEMQTLDASVHNFLKSLNSKQNIELLILAYTAPQYIAEYHQRLTTLAVNQSTLTDKLNDFYLCSGLKQTEIDTRFGKTFKNHNKLLQHLQMHDTAFIESKFTNTIETYHSQAISFFGDNESGVLPPLKLTQSIFNKLAKNYAQKATIFDLWKLKEARGTEHFMRVTGLNIMKFSPQAKLQEHLDRGLSEDSFLMFGAPGDGEEYPQSIHYLARELSGYDGSGSLPTVDEIPNRSKLAIVVAISEENKQQLVELLSQYEAAASQFKTRSAQRYSIKDWQQTVRQASNMDDALQMWAINNYQQIRKQADIIDQLLNPKAAKDWQAMIEAIHTN